MNRYLKPIFFALLLSMGVNTQSFAAKKAPIEAFTTGGHVVYQLTTLNLQGGKRGVALATFDGTVLCRDESGKPIWECSDSKNFPFAIAAADIDGDGADEVFVATAGGTLDAYSSKGKRLWSYETKANLFAVAPIKTTDGAWRIFTGGIEEELFILTIDGKLEKSIPAGNVVRHIKVAKRAGKSPSIVVATAIRGLGGGITFLEFDPNTLTQIGKEVKITDAKKGAPAYSMLAIDLDSDGTDEIVAAGGSAALVAFDSNFKPMWREDQSPKIAYRMTILSEGKVNGKRVMVGQYGGYIIIYDLDGNVKETIKSYGDYTNSYLDQKSNRLYIGSSSSGGDGVYAVDLNSPRWRDAFEMNRYVGRMAEVEANIAEMNKQIRNFKRPSYQRPVEKLSIYGADHKIQNYKNMVFARTHIMTQKITAEERDQLWCRRNEAGKKRYLYDKTQAEIVDFAREQEVLGKNFTMWGCHGSAMFMSPETMRKVIEAAPKHFVGFLMTEMEKIDDNMRDVVNEIIVPLADFCIGKDKKIIFWNKNIFWCGSCYVDFWHKALLNPKYKSVFVPALEETNSRTQELSLAGNVGLWSTDFFDSWSCRIVSDNTSFDRMWEWGSLHNPSIYYRQVALQASYGADIFFTDVNQGEVGVHLRDQFAPIHQLLSKGVVAVPRRGESLSISPLCFGMSTPPAKNYLDSGKNGHTYNFNEVEQKSMIFNRMDAYWGAAPMVDYDFSKYGYGCERRHLNFLPTLPYGMIPIIPDDIDISTHPVYDEMVKIDGEFFYDEAGNKIPAKEYQGEMVKRMEAAADKMLLRVDGKVSWSAVKLDDTHMRVLLIDPGYVDPADRKAVVKFQHIEALKATNMLTNESLNLSKNSIEVTVPAGIFSVIDIEYK